MNTTNTEVTNAISNTVDNDGAWWECPTCGMENCSKVKTTTEYADVAGGRPWDTVEVAYEAFDPTEVTCGNGDPEEEGCGVRVLLSQDDDRDVEAAYEQRYSARERIQHGSMAREWWER
jgi:hypothetical protein